ncbi:hypothetical protein NFHSH190041_23410 [Shewanella sp. NFH-SH190041]|nr:hypothetical protein NFHSH190041_23410 [Shewanella sp. NFH-SH190041]
MLATESVKQNFKAIVLFAAFVYTMINITTKRCIYQHGNSDKGTDTDVYISANTGGYYFLASS